MEKKTHKNGNHTGSKVAAGVGIAALAAAAAGAIFLYGTDAGKKRRKQIESWSLRMKADVIDRMSKMKDWSEESYGNLVDMVTEKYKNVKNIDKTELLALAADLKRHWNTIRKQAEGKPQTRRTTKSKSTRTTKTTHSTHE